MNIKKANRKYSGSFIKTMNVFFGVALLLVLSGCFSPWKGEEGNLTVSLDGPARAIGDISAENSNFDHEIILDGPGGTVSQTFKKGTTSASFQLAAGTWNVTVRAMGQIPDDNQSGSQYRECGFPDRMLRALGFTSVQIAAGQNTIAKIPMVTATEVFTPSQLSCAINMVNMDRMQEYILIANDIAIYPVSLSNQSVTLLAEKDVRLTRDDYTSTDMIDIENGSELTLGGPGMKGGLTIDGSWKGDDTNPCMGTIIHVGSDSALEMNDGIVLCNNNNTIGDTATGGNGGAIYLDSGSITMNGGSINNNTCTGSCGGGVYVNSGSFTMNGGSITGNTLPLNLNTSNRGGGVYIRSGTFTMNGGSITGNTSVSTPSSQASPAYDSFGGGVYVDSDGAFTMGNSAMVSGNNGYNGGAFYVDGTVTMNDYATVSGNAAVFGGGIYVSNGSFYITGGTIYGSDVRDTLANTATIEAGAALFQYNSVYNKAEYGTLNDGVWNGTAFDLSISTLFSFADTTIRVVNGVLIGKNQDTPATPTTPTATP